jgi:septum site-determining protein MinC
MAAEVQFKGIREGLLVTLGDSAWPDLEQELFAEIGRQGDFLKGAKLILDVNAHSINAASMSRLRDQIADHGLSLWGVLSLSPLTERSAQAMGLATRIFEGTADVETEFEEEENDITNEPAGQTEPDSGLMVRHTLRSGAQVNSAGHVTVIGDVNPGAQIIAGGNVVVWGRLRGMVHAGAAGDEEAVVCALDLSPTQLRIATHIAIPPTERGGAAPEIAFVRNGQVVAETWSPQQLAVMNN